VWKVIMCKDVHRPCCIATLDHSLHYDYLYNYFIACIAILKQFVAVLIAEYARQSGSLLQSTL
jgi:hypothetical protein